MEPLTNEVHLPKWSTVQRVIELVKAAEGRLRKEAHIPQPINFSVPERMKLEGARPGLRGLTSGCKMHSRIDLPDSSGPDHTTLCVICDGVDLMPRVARELS